MCEWFCCGCFADLKSNSATSSRDVYVVIICSIPFRLKGFEHVFYPSSIVDTCVSSCFCSYLQKWLELLVQNWPAGKDEGWQKKKEVQDDEEEDAWVHILAVEQSSTPSLRDLCLFISLQVRSIYGKVIRAGFVTFYSSVFSGR